MIDARIVYFAAAVLLHTFTSVLMAEDRMKIVETPINWHVNPFQSGGYSSPSRPSSFNNSIYKGAVSMALERDSACVRIDRAFAKAGFKMKRNVAYDRDGVTCQLTGYDAEQKVGYVWGGIETLGEGFFSNASAKSDKEKRIRLSAAEAKLLEDRAPMTREFIAVIIPYTHRLGYVAGYSYRDAKEKAMYEKRRADTAEERLVALDRTVAEYFRWRAERVAEDYPAPTAEPRNLLTFARWSVAREYRPSFGECGVGQPQPLAKELAKKVIERCGADAKLDLGSSFEFKTDAGSVTFTGFDRKRKIGYVLRYPADKNPQRKADELLAKQAAAKGLRIAWVSPGDPRFDSSRFSRVPSNPPRYAARITAIQKIADPTKREQAIQALSSEVALHNAQPVLKRLERRMTEFMEWAEKE